MFLIRLPFTIIFFIDVMAVTAGPRKVNTLQNTPFRTEAQQENIGQSYTANGTRTHGGYYNSAVMFLTNGCRSGTYSIATVKAITFGLFGGLLGAYQASTLGVTARNPTERIFIGPIIVSTIELDIGLTDSYNGFKSKSAAHGKR